MSPAGRSPPAAGHPGVNGGSSTGPGRSLRSHITAVLGGGRWGAGGKQCSARSLVAAAQRRERGCALERRLGESNANQRSSPRPLSNTRDRSGRRLERRLPEGGTATKGAAGDWNKAGLIDVSRLQSRVGGEAVFITWWDENILLGGCAGGTGGGCRHGNGNGLAPPGHATHIVSPAPHDTSQPHIM